MRPIVTASTNGVLKGSPGKVVDLPVTHTVDMVTQQREVSSCWAMTWQERLRALWFGRVWFDCHGDTHPPIRLRLP